MYMIKKIFCIGDRIKSIPSPKINIFIYNNILLYCTDFCAKDHMKYILKKTKKKKTKYNIFFLHTFLKVHDDQYLGRTSLKLMCERLYDLKISLFRRIYFFKFFPEESVFWLSCKYLETWFYIGFSCACHNLKKQKVRIFSPKVIILTGIFFSIYRPTLLPKKEISFFRHSIRLMIRLTVNKTVDHTVDCCVIFFSFSGGDA